MGKARDSIAESVGNSIEAMGIADGPGELARDLEVARALMNQYGDPSRALDAMMLLALHHDTKAAATGKALEPASGIFVPWWVVGAMATAWGSYCEAASNSKKLRLGQCFGVEGAGQAKRSPRVLGELEKGEWMIAFKIAEALPDEGDKIYLACERVAKETGMSEAQLRKIWSKHRARVRRMMKISG